MKRALTFFLLLCLLTVHVSAWGTPDAAQPLHEAAQGICALLESDDPLADKDLLPAGDSSGDWIALTFALAEEKGAYSKYAKRLDAYVAKAYKQNGGLGAHSATQGQRIVLTAAALGADPTAFGGTINLLADTTYNYRQNGEDLFDQGLNACIFALLALDCKAYPVPEGSRYTRASLLAHLLSAQREDGAFGLTQGGADAEMTAMAVQALAAYTKQPAAEDAAQRALDWLSGQRAENGMFPSKSSETVSQVIIAVASMGLDVYTEPRFLKNGVTLLQTLETYRQPDGSFAHDLADGEGNVLATQQAMLALLAVKKQKEGVRLYDCSAVPAQKNTSRKWVWFVVPAGATLLAVAAFLMIRRKKHHG